MKKIRLSLAALTLILAIAGTTTANATNSQEEVPKCNDFDPDRLICTDESNIECCEDDDTHEIITEFNRPL